MPNKTAAKKFMIKSEIQRQRNKAIKTKVRNLAKATAVAAGKEEGMKALKEFEKYGMSSVSKGVFHINTIARKISRLYARVKQLNA